MNDFLNKLRRNLAQGMYGRNGSDTLGYAAIILAILFIVAEWFIGGGLLSTCAMACLLYAMFRQFSTNVTKRREENAAFLRLLNKVRNFAPSKSSAGKNKDSLYFTCENCGATYSLPKGKGKVRATCPRCQTKSIRDTK